MSHRHGKARDCGPRSTCEWCQERSCWPVFLAPFPESQALWGPCVKKERRKRDASPARACITQLTLFLPMCLLCSSDGPGVSPFSSEYCLVCLPQSSADQTGFSCLPERASMVWRSCVQRLLQGDAKQRSLLLAFLGAFFNCSGTWLPRQEE